MKDSPIIHYSPAIIHSSSDDTTAIRPDERLDETAIVAYLRGKLPYADRALTIRQFGGGAANLTYLLDYGAAQYVLRRPPLGAVAKSAHDMGREYKVLSRLHEQFPAAPRALLFCDDSSVMNAPFFIMERKQGIVVRKTLPPAFAAIPDAPHRLSHALVETLAAFHAVDYAAIGLSDLGKPDGFIQRQVEGWYRRWNHAKTEELAAMDAVYGWLMAHLPPAAAPTLIHNDYKLDNAMFAADDPDRIVAIFDWDMCTLGDPLNDLGAMLAYWRDPADPDWLQAVSTMPAGFPSRAEIVEWYGKKSGRSTADINFYHILGLFRLAVIIAQIYIRYQCGQTQDKRFAAFGAMVPLMAKQAQELCERGRPSG